MNGCSDRNMNVSEQIHFYSVGDVCALLGMTRKTLFYYDRIGLAKPTERIGPQGYKVYDETALNRLRQIAGYRQAGLTVEEIRCLLDPDCVNEIGLLTTALERLRTETEELRMKTKRLASLLEEAVQKQKTDSYESVE